MRQPCQPLRLSQSIRQDLKASESEQKKAIFGVAKEVKERGAAMCPAARDPCWGVSSCAAPDGRYGRSNGCRSDTGMAWHLCVSCNDVLTHQTWQTANHIPPTYTCTASHLGVGREMEESE